MLQNTHIFLSGVYCILYLQTGALLYAAKEKQDARLLRLLSTGDCVALEVCYHSVCYKAYTRPIKAKTTQDKWVLSAST